MTRNLDVEFPVYEDSRRPMAGERGPGQGWGDWLDDDEEIEPSRRYGGERRGYGVDE